MFRHTPIIRFSLIAAVALGASQSAIAQKLVHPHWVVGGSLATAPPQYSYDGTKILFSNPKSANTIVPVNGFRVYDAQKGTCLDIVTLQNGTTLGATFTADAKGVFYGAVTGTAYTVWRHDLAAGTEKNIHIRESSPITQLCASPDGKVLAYYAGSTVKIFDLTLDKVTGSFAAQTASLGFIANSSEIVVSGPGIYDLTGQKIVAANNGVNPVAISPDSSTLVTGFASGNLVKAFDAKTLAINWSKSLPVGYVATNPAFSSDGKAVLFASGASGSWLVQGVAASSGAPLHNHLTMPLTGDTSGDIPWIATSPTANQLTIGPGGVNPHAEVWQFDSALGSGSSLGTLFETSYSGVTLGGAVTRSNPYYAIAAKAAYSSNPITSILDAFTSAALLQLPPNAVVAPDGGHYFTIDPGGVTVHDLSNSQGARSASLLGIKKAGWDMEGVQLWLIRDLGGPFEVDIMDARGDSQGGLGSQSSFRYATEVKEVALSSVNSALAVLAGTDSASTVYTYHGQDNGVSEGYVLVGKVIPDATNTGEMHHIVLRNTGTTVDTLVVSELAGAFPFNHLCRLYTINYNSLTPLGRFSYPMKDWNATFGSDILSSDVVAMYDVSPKGNGIDPLIASSLRYYRLSDGYLLRDYENQFTPGMEEAFPMVRAFGPSGIVFSTGGQGALVSAPSDSWLESIYTYAGILPGGASTTGVLDIQLDTGDPTTVKLSSSSKSVTVPSSVTYQNNQQGVPTFQITTRGVDSETTATLNATYEGITVTTPLIVQPASALTLTLSTGTVRAGSKVTGKVTLDALAGPSGVLVKLSSKVPTLATISPSVIRVAANTTTATFTITTRNPAANQTVEIDAAAPGYAGSANLTVNTLIPSRVAFDRGSVKGGTSVNLIVTLPVAAPTSGVKYTLVSESGALTPPTTVTIPAGSSSITIAVPTKPVLTSTAATVDVTSGGVTLAKATTTVLPPVIKSVTPSETTAQGAGTAYATVTLDGPAPAGFTVAASSNNAAITVPATTVIAAGHSTVQVKLTIAAVKVKTAVAVTVGSKTFTITLTP